MEKVRLINEGKMNIFAKNNITFLPHNLIVVKNVNISNCKYDTTRTIYNRIRIMMLEKNI